METHQQSCSGRRAGGLLAVAISISSLTLACREATNPPRAPEAGSSPELLVIRPGDSLLDHLDALQIEQYPDTNLDPEAVRLVRRPKVTVETPLKGPWRREVGYARLLRKLDRRDPRVFWASFVPIASREKGLPIRVFRGEREIPLTDGSSESFPPPPSEVILWVERFQAIYVLSEKPPRGLAVRYQAESRELVGGLELRLAVGKPDGEAIAAFPAAAALLRRAILSQGPGTLSTASLLAPAPAVLSLPIGRLEASELRTTLAILPQGYPAVGERLRWDPTLSDGVVFAAEVESNGSVERVFERFVTPEELEKGPVEVRIPLERWVGQAITLRLVTEPGSEGDARADYAAFGVLRFAGRPRRPPSRPHVVLLHLDTLRADRMSLYGSLRRTTPRLDAWAKDNAVVYLDASATASWTLPSTATILTGLAPSQHRVWDLQHRVTAHMQPLALRLREAGYETVAFTEGLAVGPEYGMDVGFDRFWAGQPDLVKLVDYVRGRGSERPLFLYFQTFYVHAPYGKNDRFADPDYGSWLLNDPIEHHTVISPFNDGHLKLTEADRQYISSRYDARIGELDKIVANLIGRLDEAFAGQPYLLILLSDHGEEFFERGKMGHGQSLYEELTHVPMVVRYPRAADGRLQTGRVSGPVSTWDVVPTVLDIAGLPADPALPGRSLRNLEDARPIVAFRKNDQFVLRSGSLKYHRRGTASRGEESASAQLYDLTTDPAEEHDLAAERQALARQLDAQLSEFLKRWPPLSEEPAASDAVTDPALMERLRALGYVD